MKRDPVEWIGIIVGIIGWLMVALGLIGERLGWWNDVGEAIVTVGAVGGLVGPVLALITDAGRRQLARVEEGVLAGNALSRANGRQLEKLDKLDKLDDLDLIQLQLDRQTGVLEQQLVLLRDIRDRAG